MRKLFRLIWILLVNSILGAFIILLPWYALWRSAEKTDIRLLNKFGSLEPQQIVYFYIAFVAIASLINYFFTRRPKSW